MSWKTVSFESLYAVPSRNGVSVAKNQHDGDTKIVNMGELFASDFIGDIPMRRIKVEQKQLSANALGVGDLLFARRSLVASGAGKVSMVSDLKEPTVFESSIIRVRLDQTKALPRFYAYWFRSPDGIDAISRLVTGTNVKGIRGSELRSVQVPAPALDEQRRIASILMAYDSLIENNRKQIALLEETAQRLYKKWFVDLHFPGHEGAEMIDGLPFGWHETRLSDIADVVMGQSPKSEYYNDDGEGLPFHQGVGSYGLRFVNDQTFTTYVTRIGKAGSILFSVRAPVGRLNYTKNEIVIGRGLAAMNHRDGMQSYLYYLLKERFFKEDMIGNGSIFASISKSDLLAQRFIVPTDSLAERFDSICRPIDRQIEVLDDAIHAAREARDRLLPKLMSGEIEVEE